VNIQPKTEVLKMSEKERFVIKRDVPESDEFPREKYARKWRAEVEIELRHKESCAPHLDIDLKPCQEYTELSICGTVQGPHGFYSGGQNTDEIRRSLGSDPLISELCDIWERWHMNGLCSGTREQRDWLRENPREWDRMNYYTEQCNDLKAADLYEVRGYKFGHSWLVERIPGEVIERVREIASQLAA
jgi:hypothetical protein